MTNPEPRLRTGCGRRSNCRKNWLKGSSGSRFMPGGSDEPDSIRFVLTLTTAGLSTLASATQSGAVTAWPEIFGGSSDQSFTGAVRVKLSCGIKATRAITVSTARPATIQPRRDNFMLIDLSPLRVGACSGAPDRRHAGHAVAPHLPEA